ncbi:gp27 [Shigella phage Buco]|uniref:Uncharacterized protein n=1 Tax=Shigella phage Buco TaxID=2530183 RepID=A0A482JKT8_9CAUD|nr:gp27 [Shigella phage Buco]QBP32927.1 hypothetical protein HRP29_gp27 [Shigella phage Buco]
MRSKLSILFAAPAGLLMATGIVLLGLGGLIAGQGFLRPTRILSEEFRDALVTAKARLLASRRK